MNLSSWFTAALRLVQILFRVSINDIVQRMKYVHDKQGSGFTGQVTGEISGRSLMRSLARSVVRSLVRSLARSVVRSLARSVVRSLARSLAGHWGYNCMNLLMVIGKIYLAGHWGHWRVTGVTGGSLRSLYKYGNWRARCIFHLSPHRHQQQPPSG